MPLAPAARTMIDQLEAGGGPALWEMSVDDARSLSAVMGAMDQPPEVVKVEDRVIPGPAGDLPVRIYTPDAPAPRPVIDSACDAPSYTENAEGYFLTAPGMHWFWAHYLGPDGDSAHQNASPIRAS